jgi:hypothetical protein
MSAAQHGRVLWNAKFSNIHIHIRGSHLSITVQSLLQCQRDATRELERRKRIVGQTTVDVGFFDGERVDGTNASSNQ